MKHLHSAHITSDVIHYRDVGALKAEQRIKGQVIIHIKYNQLAWVSGG